MKHGETFYPGDMVICPDDAGIVWLFGDPMGADTDVDDIMLFNDLSASEHALVIIPGKGYTFIMVRGVIGYIATHRITKEL